MGLLTALSIALVTTSADVFAREKWTITSLDWQPFSGRDLADGGIAITVLREALSKEGIDLNVLYYPWTRAVKTAADPALLGYYPAWREEVLDGFSASSVIFTSPVVFVENVNHPLKWTKLNDLKGKTIGVVQNYGNTTEFNALVAKGVIKTEIAQDDLTNIRKVAMGRIDGAFIDLYNLKYYLKKEARDFESLVQANPRIIAEKSIHLAINNHFANKKAAEIIKRATEKIKSQKKVKKFLQTLP